MICCFCACMKEKGWAWSAKIQVKLLSWPEHQILLPAVIMPHCSSPSRAVKWSVSVPAKQLKCSFRQNMRTLSLKNHCLFCWWLKEGQWIQTCTKLHKTCSATFEKILTFSAPSLQICLAPLWQFPLVLCCSLVFFLTFLWLPVILTLELTTQPYPTEFDCTVVCTSPLKQNLKHDNMAFSSGGKKWKKCVFLISFGENLNGTGTCSWRRCSPAKSCTLRAHQVPEPKPGSRTSGLGTPRSWQSLAYPTATELESLEDRESAGIGLYSGSRWLHWLLEAVGS